MKHSFIRSEPLKTWDKVSIASFILLSLVIWYFFPQLSIARQRDTIYFYALGTQLFLYLFNYISLRNFRVYLFWFFVGVVHFATFLNLKNDYALSYLPMHSANGLRNTLILLILFQGLRFWSLEKQGMELVCPSRHGTDIFDTRKIKPLDMLLFFLYLFATFGLFLIR